MMTKNMTHYDACVFTARVNLVQTSTMTKSRPITITPDLGIQPWQLYRDNIRILWMKISNYVLNRLK